MSDRISPHEAVYSVCRVVAAALKVALPRGFSGKLTVTVANGEVDEHNVGVEFRPPQPKAGMGK